ncbi:MAG: hypothetical protein J0M07_00455 [Anaerolineae bacterium]|jgi:hypothetical protein|nr:hypothetical protein [Chloroflexota bacterium]MBN8633761.1 hypothetical protein [Anaerolineae bacterium]
MAKLRVLVKGSIEKPEDSWSEQQKQDYAKRIARYAAACKTLGRLLARKGMTIVVGVPQWENLLERRAVAAYVMEGANEEPLKDGKKHKVVFYSPNEVEPVNTTPELDSLAELRKLENLEIEDKFLGAAAYSASMIPDVQISDVILLIGGGEGTASIGFSAYSLNKPIVALASFGGAAKSIFDALLFRDYQNYSRRQRDGITDTDIRALLADWSDGKTDDPQNLDNAEKIVKLVAALPRLYKRDNAAASGFLRLTLAVMLLFLVTWVALFLRSSDWGITSDMSFFALLFISAAIGTGLRSLVAYQQYELYEIDGMSFAIDLIISLILSLGLAFIYLLGGYSFTGEVVVIGDQERKTVMTIAITMSVLGLAAGYLVPLAQLRTRLEGFLKTQDEAQSLTS